MGIAAHCTRGVRVIAEVPHRIRVVIRTPWGLWSPDNPLMGVLERRHLREDHLLVEEG